MACSKELFGTLENGAKLTKYILTNEHGLKASFTDLGAIWLEMYVPDKNGKFSDVVLGFDAPEKYLDQDVHFGEIVGRNANRIGTATCTIDGITHALVINDNGDRIFCVTGSGMQRFPKQRKERRSPFPSLARTATRTTLAMPISVSATP